MIDSVFSLDSVITAVGMVQRIPVMLAAIVLAVLVMMILAPNVIGEFIDTNPTVRMLVLAFLLLVGLALVADGFGYHIPRAYIDLAMAFSAGVEVLNTLTRRRARH